MSGIRYGAPLTGAQMRLLQAAGLPDDVMVKPPYGTAEESINFCYLTNGYRLPAKHIAYTLLEKGWLDIPNVRLWFGGDKVPDDWGGGRLLLSNGEWISSTMIEDRDWKHGTEDEYDIIAYIAGDEAPRMEVTADVNDTSKIPPVRHIAPPPDTVILNKMTETEWARLIGRGGYDILIILDELGLIKSEPTLEERFWQGKERNSLSQDEAVKALVREAVKFGQENPE